MRKLKPINLNNGILQIHPLQYNKEKFVQDKETISTQMLGMSLKSEDD